MEIRFFFISASKKFHAYGVNANGLNSNRSGFVEVYDFQDLTRKVVKYKEGKAEKFQHYPSDGLLNAYKGLYPVNDLKATNAGLRPNSDNPTLVKAIRKFFCQLFGGFWRNSIAENSNNPNGDCSFGDNNNEVPVDFVGDEGGGGASWGLIFPNLNDLNFFDLTSTMWNNIQSGLNGGSSANNWNLTTPAGTIDPSCTDPERIRTLFYILNTKSNQQLSYVDYGSFENTLAEYQTYKNQLQVPLPITPLLLKGGPNGSVDALLQAQYLYQTENNAPSFGAAFGHDNFSRMQAAASISSGLSYWSIPPFSIGTSAFIALEDVLVKEIDGAYGNTNYDLLGYDFIAKFYQQLGIGNIDVGNPKNTLNSINPDLYYVIQQLDLTPKKAFSLLPSNAVSTQLSQFLQINNDYLGKFRATVSIEEYIDGYDFSIAPFVWQNSNNNDQFVDINPTLEPTFQFPVDNNYETIYPRFTDLVKNLKTFVKENPKVLNALQAYSGLSKTTILDHLSFGEGPIIKVVEMDGRIGQFKKLSGNKTLEIRASYVRGLEQANLLCTKEATAFLLAVTILHEYVHYGNFSISRSEGIYDFGTGFERDAFNVIVEPFNAAEVVISFTKYFTNL